MNVGAGTKLGRYEIRSRIGQGGMGEVYRARDGNLNRDVAIKILPRDFSENAERLNRFEQEAQAAGALNHPNILAVYDVGKHEDSPFVVSELLEGDNLRAAAHGAPLPQRKAIDYALQIARGLGAAHDKGIIHRDLKPENIFVTKDGRVKILDFGLAKLVEPAGNNAAQTDVPTRKVRTDAGRVMGTVGYMSPEQVRGQSVDHRSDIFSFGAVLYEMLSGQRAFKGDSQVETLNSILKEDPAELTGSNQYISPAVERVVNHCLEKNPESRFQTAADLVFALENVSLSKTDLGRPEVLSQPSRPERRERLIWIAVVLFLLVGITAIALWSFRKPSRESEAARFPIAIPAGSYPIAAVEEHNMAISPDGRYLAFAVLSEGKRLVSVRPIGSLSAQTLPGTEGASSVFWSPDSRNIAFFADRKLKRIEVSGKSLQTICDLTAKRASGTWGNLGTIVFSQDADGKIYRVPAVGGNASLLVDNKSRAARRWVQFLPDGRRFIFYKSDEGEHNAGIFTGSLDSSEIKQVAPMAAARAVYAKGGYLLYPREGSLVAQSFDETSLKLTGEPAVLVDRLPYFDKTGWAEFSVSDTGVLAYMTESPKTRLVWLDRAGRETGQVGEAGDIYEVRIAPDGQRAVVNIADPGTSSGGDLWIQDLSRATLTRFVFGSTDDGRPVWSPDGRRLAYFSCCEDVSTLHIKDTSDPGKGELPVKDQSFIAPLDWSRDGRFIIYQEGQQLWVLPVSGDPKPYPLKQTIAAYGNAHLSTDGRWLAFVSAETGRAEVYVTRFDQPGERFRISTEGGNNPRWRHDNSELFYESADSHLMSVAIKPGEKFEAGAPVALFQADPLSPDYDVTADGQRFLFIASAPGTQLLPFAVVLGWMAELKR